MQPRTELGSCFSPNLNASKDRSDPYLTQLTEAKDADQPASHGIPRVLRTPNSSTLASFEFMSGDSSLLDDVSFPR